MAFCLCFVIDISYATPNEAYLAHLLRQGQLKMAMGKLKKSQPTQIDLLFFNGLVLKYSGQFSKAVAIFREVLRQNPNHKNAKRELAHALFLAGHYDSAKFHFKQLLDQDRDPKLQNLYNEFLRQINTRQPYGLSGSFSFLPSTNINRGTSNTELGEGFIINPQSRVNSGVGINLGISGYFRRNIDKKNRALLNWSIAGNRYNNSRYNSVTLRLQYRHQHFASNYRWNLGPYWQYGWRKDKGDNRRYGLQYNAEYNISKKNQISYLLHYEYRDYLFYQRNNGNYVRGLLAFTHFPRNDLSLSTAVSLSRSNPRLNYQKYTGWQLSGRVLKLWKGGLVTVLGVKFGKRNYDGHFPILNRVRDDKYYEINMAVHNSKINFKGFTPRLSCFYTRNFSNIAFYDYDVTECQVTLSRDF